MAITGVNNQTYATSYIQKTRSNSQQSTAKVSQEDMVKELQEKNPQLDLSVGRVRRNAKAGTTSGRTDVRVAPEILNQMKNDPKVAAKYEKMLSHIPALNQWADSMIKSITGSEVKYRQVWIDEDGNMGSMCITGPSEAQKKKEEEKAEKKTTRKETANRKTYEKLLEKRRTERKERMEKMTKATRTIVATGTDIKSITENVVAMATGTASSAGTGFDIKA